jgi:hypothetical protein
MSISPIFLRAPIALIRSRPLFLLSAKTLTAILFSLSRKAASSLLHPSRSILCLHSSSLRRGAKPFSFSLLPISTTTPCAELGRAALCHVPPLTSHRPHCRHRVLPLPGSCTTLSRVSSGTELYRLSQMGNTFLDLLLYFSGRVGCVPG